MGHCTMRMSIFSVQDHYPTQARTVPELYKHILAQAELADRLGYDTFWVAEHHFHEYGAVPNPAICWPRSRSGPNACGSELPSQF